MGILLHIKWPTKSCFLHVAEGLGLWLIGLVEIIRGFSVTKTFFTFLHNIALLDILRIASENFLLEAIIALPEKQGGKRYISCTQHADKANLYVTKTGTALYEIKPTFKYPITNKEVGTFIQCKCSDFFTEQDWWRSWFFPQTASIWWKENELLTTTQGPEGVKS